LIYSLGGNVNTAITEFIEQGDGRYSKGRTMQAGDALYFSEISKLGWDEKKTWNTPVLLLVYERSVLAPFRRNR